MKFRLTAVLLVCGIILAVIGGKGVITNLLPAKDLYDPNLDWTKLKSGQRINTEVDFVDYPLVVSYEDNVEVSAVYTLLDLQTNSEGYYYVAHFMGVAVPRENFKKYDRMAEASWKWFQDETNTVEWAEGGTDYIDGYLRKMGKEEKKYAYETIVEMGYTQSEAEEMLIPLVLVRSQSMGAYLFMLIGGVILTALGALFGVLFFVLKK